MLGGAKSGNGTSSGSNIHWRNIHDNTHHGRLARDDTHHGLHARDPTKEGAKKETKGLGQGRGGRRGGGGGQML